MILASVNRSLKKGGKKKTLRRSSHDCLAVCTKADLASCKNLLAKGVHTDFALSQVQFRPAEEIKQPVERAEYTLVTRFRVDEIDLPERSS